MKAVSEQSYDYMEAYFLAQELADKKMEESQMEYEIDYYAFAANNNIEIIESESDLSKKMKISNEVFKHYKEMYLIFFKVSINEIPPDGRHTNQRCKRDSAKFECVKPISERKGWKF